MKKYLLIAATVLFLNSCKKDKQENNLVGTKWNLSKIKILGENTCDFTGWKEDFKKEPDKPYPYPVESPSSGYNVPYTENNPFIVIVPKFGHPDTPNYAFPIEEPIGFLTFTSLLDINLTAQQTKCEGNFLDRICNTEIVTRSGKYIVKDDSISFTMDNVAKKGKFLSKDSLVILTCAPLSYENPISTSSKPPYGWLLLGELYVRSK